MVEKVALLELKNQISGWEEAAQAAINNCPKIKKDREKEILSARFGIGEKPQTLQAIGDRYNITRERVRQIVNNALSKVARHCTDSKAQSIIRAIEANVRANGGYNSLTQLGAELTSGDKAEINALHFMASLSSKIENVKTSSELREGWRTKVLKTSKLKEAAKAAIKVLKDNKKVMTTQQIAEQTGSDKSLMNAALSASNKTMLTDNGEWGLVSWPHVNPKSIRDKSRYIMERHGEPIHYEELAGKISGLGKKRVTKQSVHNELIKNPDFVLVGRGIYALTDWGYSPGIVEEVIYEILSESGEPLHKDIIVEKVLERRIVKPTTIVLNLQKPRFKKVGKSVYTIN